MKICQTHWDMLRAAIDERGLGNLVAPSGEALVDRLKSQVTPGESEAAGFDPLANANFAIWSNALESGGGYLVFGNPETGEPYCPICEAALHVPDGEPQKDPSWWINHAADEQLERARVLKLVPPIQ